MATPLTLDISGLDFQITAAPLEQAAFAEFGQISENPRPEVHPSSSSSLPFGAVSANQGSAIKYQHVAHLANLYDQAPSSRSTRPASPVANLFSCAARAGSPGSTVPIRVLERHPFTSQTFSPLTSAAAATGNYYSYLVVVAPSRPPGPTDEGLPVPGGNNGDGPPLPGRGLPDLSRLRAFVGRASQAVTYGPGTWHAPMVALGAEGAAVDFLVVQFASGVGVEDCQEVVLEGGKAAAGQVLVRIPPSPRQAKL